MTTRIKLLVSLFSSPGCVSASRGYGFYNVVNFKLMCHVLGEQQEVWLRNSLMR